MSFIAIMSAETVAVSVPTAAVADVNETDEATTLNISAGSGVLSNDSGSGLAVTDIANGVTNVSPTNPIAGNNGGIFTVAADGSYVFDPNDEFEGLGVGETDTTSVTITIEDDSSTTDTSTLVITVTGINDDPTVDTPISNQTDAAGDTITPLDISGNFADVDTNDVLTFTAEGLPAGLSLDLNTGIISGTIDVAADSGSPYTVTITADDGTATVEDEFTWTVDPIAATATPDVNSTDQDTTLNVVAGSGVLSNDLGASLAVTDIANGVTNVGAGNPIAGADGGIFTIESDGAYVFDPNGEFDGLTTGQTDTTSVTVTITDGDSATDTATLVITINGLNDPPVLDTAESDQNYTDGESITPLDLSGNFSDADVSDTLQFTASGLPTGLSIHIDTGIVSGTVDESASASSPYSVTITATDDADATATDTITFTISAPASGFIDDFETGSDLTSPWQRFNEQDSDDYDVSLAGGRFRGHIKNGSSDIWFNASQGQLDAIEVNFPFQAIARNIGIGTVADSQVDPSDTAGAYIFSGLNVHHTTYSETEYQHMVPGDRNETYGTIEYKSNVDDVSYVADLGADIDGGAKRFDLMCDANSDGELAWYWQPVGTSPDAWTEVVMPWVHPDLGTTSALVGLVTYTGGGTGTPFVGTCDEVEQPEYDATVKEAGARGTIHDLDSTSDNVLITIPAACKMILVLVGGYNNGNGEPTITVDINSDTNAFTTVPNSRGDNEAFGASNGNFCEAFILQEGDTDWPSTLPEVDASITVNTSVVCDIQTHVIMLYKAGSITDADIVSVTSSSDEINFPTISSNVTDEIYGALWSYNGSPAYTSDDSAAVIEDYLTSGGVDCVAFKEPGAETSKDVGGDFASNVTAFLGVVVSVASDGG